METTLKKENLDEEKNITHGGDFNCPLNPVLDKKRGILLLRKSVVATIDCLCADLDLVDIWRVKNLSTKSYTWSQSSPMILCHLDYWLISNNLQNLVATTDIIPAIKTDHAAISIEFSISEKHIKGPGHWKMNCSLLDDEDHVREVTAKIPIWLIGGEQGGKSPFSLLSEPISPSSLLFKPISPSSLTTTTTIYLPHKLTYIQLNYSNR